MLLIRKNMSPVAAPRGQSAGMPDQAEMAAHQARVALSAGREKVGAAATAATILRPMSAGGDQTTGPTPKHLDPSFALQGVSVDEAYLEGELSAIRGMLEALNSIGSPGTPTT